MDRAGGAGGQLFRVWIATYENWRPSRWNESPPAAVALEPVEEGLYSAAEAALFLEGFNSSMLDYNKPIWAVAVPISVRFEGDAVCGRPVTGYAFTGDEATPRSLERHTVYDF